MAGIVTMCAAIAACSGDDSGDAAPESTTPVVVVDSGAIPPEAIEVPVGSVVVADTNFVPEVLADDVVTAEELDDAYQHYLGCLADGGASGRYAYDIDLQVGLTVDWQLAGSDSLGRASNTLDIGCSESYIGNIANHYFDTTPRPDDLQQRQHDSIVACVEAIDPDVAREVPDDITTDTDVAGVYIDEVQVDVAFLGATEEDAGEISLCFTRVGVPWREFGASPPTDESDSESASTS